MSYSVNDEAVCRTAPATPGLLTRGGSRVMRQKGVQNLPKTLQIGQQEKWEKIV